jgi:outer membrane lipoprotein-sorting protein
MKKTLAFLLAALLGLSLLAGCGDKPSLSERLADKLEEGLDELISQNAEAAAYYGQG